MKPFLVILSTILFASSLKAQRNDPSGENREAQIKALKYISYPEFPGGRIAWFKFLSKNLKWPNKDYETQGRVVVNFTVEQDGRLTDMKIVKSLFLHLTLKHSVL